MGFFVVFGCVLVLLGIVLIVVFGMKVAKLRGLGLEDEIMRKRVEAILPYNLAGILISGLGLGAVCVGLFLGAKIF